MREAIDQSLSVLLGALLAVGQVPAHARDQAGAGEKRQPLGSQAATAGVPSASGRVRAMRLIAPGTGWLLRGQQLYWTRDNGGNWADITPSGYPNQRVASAFFLDALHGWALLSGSDLTAAAGVSFTIAETKDAGLNWALHEFDAPSSSSPRDYTGEGSMFFLGPGRGWLMLRQSSSSNFSFGSLFATEDGGSSWTGLSSPPAGDPAYFVTPAYGWIAGGLGGDGLWTTQDGGRTWKRQAVPNPPSCAGCRAEYGAVWFQSPTEGIAPVTFLGAEDSERVTYATHDGGQTWQPLEGNQGREISMRGGKVAVVNSHIIAVYVSENAIVTARDAGEGVTSGLLAGLWPGGNLREADFADESDGWITYSAGQCAEFKSHCSQQSELLSTSDGGRSYKVITPPSAPQLSAGDSGSAQPVPAPLGEGDRRQLGESFPRVPPGAGFPDGAGFGQSSLPDPSGTAISQNQGFDAPYAPGTGSMQTWWAASPYYDVAAYIGGCNVHAVPPNGPNGCGSNPPSQGSKGTNTNLTSSWVSSVSGTGWGIMPLWVGPQAPCADQASSFYTISPTDPTSAYNEGVAEADSAVAQATNWLNITDSVIYYDMEPYTPPSGDTTCSPAVRNFLAGWVTELHAKGFPTAGVYGMDRSSNVSDFAAVVPIPDAVWLTYLDGSTYQTASTTDLEFLGGNWINYQLIHQYCFGSACAGSWGGVSINIDGDVENGPVVPGQYLPAPTLLSPANASAGVSPNPFFSWNAVSDATGYRLMVASAPSAFPVAPDAEACSSCLLNVTLGSNSYSAGAGALQSNATYYWQVKGRGQLVGYWSSPWTFATGSSSNPLPTPTTSAATAVAIASSTLNGTANPNGFATTAWFEYSSTDNTLSTYSATPSQPVGAGTLAQPFSANLTGLSGSTTYYFRAVAANANGTSNGGILSFQTLAPVAPAVSTSPATSVGVNGATMNGQLNPNGTSSTGWFEYGTSSSLSSFTATPSQPIGSDSTSHPFTWTLSGLSPGQTYYYRAAGSNSGGTNETATILSFTTSSSSSAVVTTGSPASLTSSSATLSGTVNPAGASGTAYFRYGTDPTMTSYSTSSSQNVTANSTTQAFSGTVSLYANTTYYCQMVFYNSGSNTNIAGNIVSFGTLPSVAVTLAASSIISTSATLNGTVNPAGAPGSAYFRYGTDPTMTSYSTTSSQNVTANSTTQAFSATVNLLQNTAYYYQMVFYNSVSNTNQVVNTVSFTTLRLGMTSLAATSVTSSSATLNGTINPAGASGSAYFRYGTDPTMTSYSTTSSQNVTANSSTQAFSATVNLYTNTTYYYQMAFYIPSINWNYWTTSVVSIMTLPSVETTLPASSVTSGSATLNGTINPAGSAGTAYFRVGTDPTMSSYNTTSGQTVTANSTTQAFSASLGLSTNTAYYYQMVFYNSGNNTNQVGNVLSFATLQSVPTTLPASLITSNSATLNGTINPAGSSGSAYFEYGTDPTMTSYNDTSGQSVTAASTTQAFSATVGSLTSSTTYYYRIIFRNSPTNNLQLGNILSFIAQAGVNISPPSVNFSNQMVGSTSSTQTISITNAGASALTISGIAKSGSNSGDFGESNNCGSSLNSGSLCTIQVTFAPTAAGPRRSSIVITDSASNSPQTVILTGVGTALSLSPTSLTFAAQAVNTASAAQAITLQNNGGTTVNIWQIAVQGMNAADFSTTTTCGSTLPALASCTVSITFTPAATGPRSAAILFSDNGGGSPQAVPVSGTGT